MMKHIKKLSVLSGFCITVFVVLAVYRLLEGQGWPALIASLSLGAFASGCVLGAIFRRRGVWPAAVGALLAVFLIFFPVILVTYGFALVASPALLAYASIVAAGASAAARGLEAASSPG